MMNNLESEIDKSLKINKSILSAKNQQKLN